MTEETRLFPVEGEPDSCEIFIAGGPVVWIFRLSRIVPKYAALDSLVSVEWEPVHRDQPDAGLPKRRFAPMHVNWRSGSSLESFERRLRNYFDKAKGIPFTDHLHAAAEKLDEFIFSAGDLLSAEYDEALPAPEYLIYPIWPKGSRPVVWFGQGETLKGTMAIAAAFCLTSDVSLANLRTARYCKGIVYVDYEDSYQEFNRRVNKIANGLEMVPNGLLRHFDPRGRLFIDVIEQLRGKVKAIGGADGYVIDSAIPACGGDVIKPEPVGAFFHAVASLDKPTLILAHETKEGNDEFPFGSQLWRTEPAMNVNFQAGPDGARQDVEGNWVRDVLLRCTKANNVQRFSPKAFQAVFTDDESTGPRLGRPASTWIRQIAPTMVSLDLQAKLPPVQRLVAFLRDAQDSTVKEIAEATGMTGDAVYKTLSRHETFESDGGSRGRGGAARWRVVERRLA